MSIIALLLLLPFIYTIINISVIIVNIPPDLSCPTTTEDHATALAPAATVYESALLLDTSAHHGMASTRDVCGRRETTTFARVAPFFVPGVFWLSWDSCQGCSFVGVKARAELHTSPSCPQLLEAMLCWVANAKDKDKSDMRN